LGSEERRCWAKCPCNSFPRFPTYVVLNHERYRRTDRRTDGQTTCDRNTALCTIVHRAVKRQCRTVRQHWVALITARKTLSLDIIGMLSTATSAFTMSIGWLTSQWRHRNETHNRYSELNPLQNVYLSFFHILKIRRMMSFCNDNRTILEYRPILHTLAAPLQASVSKLL